jgi:nucleotide-binding universal stress UspA family protein
MYSNVVVGIDGGPAGRDAIALAATLMSAGSRMTLMHVRVLNPAVRAGSAVFDTESREASEKLLAQERVCAAPSARTLTVLGSGVAAGLHDAAESRGADLLVVGACHRSAGVGLMCGDSIRSILDQAPCAVAVAPRGFAEHHHRRELIGVAYDGSSHSKVALAHSQALARHTGARLVAFYVIEPEVGGARAGAPLTVSAKPGERVAQAGRNLGDLVGADLTITIGSSGPELVRDSAEVDLLLCGSRHNGIVQRVVLGSTSDYLVRHCACPLVVTPAAIQRPQPAFAASINGPHARSQV